MRLYVVRHGEAERSAPTDSERALTGSGRDQVSRLWTALAGEGVKIRRLVASPFRRARETAEVIAGVYGDLDCEELPLLVPDAAPSAVLEWLLEQPQVDGLALVSHMPLVGQLAGVLAESGAARVPFSTGAVACLDVDVAASGGARLLWLRAPEAGAGRPPG